MTPQREALNIVLDLLKKEKNFKVMPSALPKTGGISAEITGSEIKSRSLNLQHGITNLTVLFLCKDKSHETACDTLYEIGNYLDRLEETLEQLERAEELKVQYDNNRQLKAANKELQEIKEHINEKLGALQYSVRIIKNITVGTLIAAIIYGVLIFFNISRLLS